MALVTLKDAIAGFRGEQVFSKSLNHHTRRTISSPIWFTNKTKYFLFSPRDTPGLTPESKS
jgi:hypothetical protein